jgi:hypothetical protein
VRHYIVVNIGARAAAHHRREESGRVETQILRTGPIVLEPPGIEIDVGQIFAAL